MIVEVIGDDLRRVLEVACLTEDRDPKEHLAMLRCATKLDYESNKRTVTNRHTWSIGVPVRRIAPLSRMADRVRHTADGEEPMPDLPPKEREKEARRFADWEAVPVAEGVE